MNTELLHVSLCSKFLTLIFPSDFGTFTRLFAQLVFVTIISYCKGSSMVLQNLRKTFLDEQDYLNPSDILNIFFVSEMLALPMANW